MITVLQDSLTSRQRENVSKWIEDLRSNGDKQGTQHLLYNGKYCCLGRACVVAGLSFYYQDNGNSHAMVGNSPWKGFAELTHDFADKEYGLLDGAGIVFMGEEVLGSLTGLNDSGFTFAQIADILQYSLDNLR